MKKSLLSAVALTAMVAFSGNAWADVLIAVAGPLTGPNAAFGAQLQKGAEQAAADINAAAASTASRSRSSSATTSPTRSRVSRSPTNSLPTASSSSSAISTRAYPSRLRKFTPKTAFSKSPRPLLTRSSPSVASGTPSAPAAVTTSRALLPANILPTTSRTPRSLSFMTRPPTVRALPTKPKRP